jgi:hypothetical protein
MSIFGNSSSEFFKSTWVYQYCRALELTPHIARKLKANTNYFVLVGQWYFTDKYEYKDRPKKADFLNALELFSFNHYNPNSEQPFGVPNEKNQYVYGSRMLLGGKKAKWYFGTGSGTDPVFIITRFVKVKPHQNMKGVLYEHNNSSSDTTILTKISNKKKETKSRSI